MLICASSLIIVFLLSSCLLLCINLVKFAKPLLTSNTELNAEKIAMKRMKVAFLVRTHVTQAPAD